MKKVLGIFMPVCLLVLTLVTTAHAASSANPPSDHQMPPDNSSPELNRIKSLEGRWTSVTDMFGKKGQRVYTEYEVTAGGSAIVERIFPGTPHEMVSVYYDDDDGKLAMTHYCMLRNRPSFKLDSKNSDEDTLALRVHKVSGAKTHEKHSMGDIEITFKDKNHIVSTCKSKNKDEPSMTMEYTRVK
jgi:hypothetical protein